MLPSYVKILVLGHSVAIFGVREKEKKVSKSRDHKKGMSATVPPIFSDPASATSSLVSNAPPPQPSKSPEEAFVNRQLAFYEEQYTVMENITIALCTFNVASKKPPTDLSLLLPSSSRLIPTGTAINSETPPDIVSVSLQEVDMSATALIKEETEAATPWVSKMRELIGADYDRSDAVCPYYPLVTKQLVGLLSFLFVKKTLMRQIKDVQVSVVATGAMGTMANKGAIGVRVVINLTAILFINAHLAAGQESTKKRNEDIATILSELKFQAQGGVDSGASTTPDSGSDAANAQETDVSTTDADVVTAKQHDVIFVSGDLNYRIDVTYEEACEMIIHNDLAGLLKQDQLKKEMRAPHTPWEKFTDIPVAFMPTYRFDIGTCTYDTSDKKRIPAFTDRILYWARSRRYQDAIRVLSMQSFPVISSSDHKPVRAIVQAPIKKVNPIARAQCVTNLRHTVEELGLDRVATAKTVISTTSLDFGVQSYLSHGKAHVITVENVGECVAEFSVCRRMEGDSTQGMWLHVSDLQMSVFPKESVELVVQCTLDSAALRPWIRTYAPFTQKAMCPLTSLLVISVVDGPAHFVECNVVVKPSAFGNTLDNLLKLRRSPCDVAYAGSPQDEIRNDAPRPQVPKGDLVFVRCPLLTREGGSRAVCGARRP